MLIDPVAPHPARALAIRTAIAAPSMAPVVALAAVLASLTPAAARAQMLGMPVLQGAFPRPGLAFGANAGNADDGSAFGGAVGWGTGNERIGIALGAAAFRPGESFRSPEVTYGGRVAFRALSLSGERLAVTPFVGAGRSRLRWEVESPSIGGASEDVEASVTRIPAGVSVGFRRGIGVRGVLAIFAAPMYAFTRSDSDTNADASNEGAFRAAAGAELGFTTGFGAIGLTVGIETGQSGADERFGTRSTAFGVGLSLARGGAR